jgi:bifunctional ADP-heptose synthase (sugar kinase/adenylyltransferase)
MAHAHTVCSCALMRCVRLMYTFVSSTLPWQVPKPSDRVVYVAGAWDMFHAGHIEILERARQ